MDIQLNFINNSNDTNHTKIVIFQKNVVPDFDELAVAWKVIENCGQGDSHPFVFPLNMAVGASDGDACQPAQPLVAKGSSFTAVCNGGEWKLVASDGSRLPEVQLGRALSPGAIDASIYKDGKLLAADSPPETSAAGVSAAKPSLLIGVAPQGSTGEAANAAIVADINTEISLLGIASADILMSGGGPDATPFTFTLENIVER